MYENLHPKSSYQVTEEVRCFETILIFWGGYWFIKSTLQSWLNSCTF